MDNANRLLAVAAYITCGVIVGFCAYAGFHQYQASLGKEGDDLPQASPADSRPYTSRIGGDEIVGPRISQIYAQREQIQRLQSLLSQKTELLERKTKLLNEKTEEQLRLQKGMETAIDLLLMLSSQVTADDGMPLGSTPVAVPTEDLTRLREQWEESLTSSGRQQEQLDLLGQELLETDETINELQRQTELEVATLMAEQSFFESTTADFVARIGESAVPDLIVMLSDEQPLIRAWAATTLGRIGPKAQEAVPSLGELLSDADPHVRASAQTSLDIIAPME